MQAVSTRLPGALGGLLLGCVVASPAAAPAPAPDPGREKPGQELQGPDPKADTSVQSPLHPPGEGPRILFDEAHGNVHRLDGRYLAFAAVLRADGYRVEPSAERFDAPAFAARLRGARILASVNATAEDGRPAFGADEIDALVRWVEGGGRLLLAVDHAPLDGGRPLARAFGYDVSGSWVRVRRDCPGAACRWDERVLFSVDAGTLEPNHPVVRGRRGRGEAVAQVTSFVGAALRPRAPGPGDAPVLVLPTPARFANPRGSRPGAGGLPQAVALTRGAGRVFVCAESALFSAQWHRKVGPVGFNAPGAGSNKQFLLNVIHWLDGVI